MKKGENIFIVSGPSGAGEDSVIEGLRDYFDIERFITTTTRKKRKGDKEGDPYYFITKKEFKARIKKGDFIEYAEQYNGNLYGTTKKEFERICNSKKIGIWKIEYKGVQIIQKKFPNIKTIFIAPPDLETLEKRINKRSKVNKNYVKERMEYTKEWMKYEKIYDYKVINEEGQLQQTIYDVKKIINKSLGKRFGFKFGFSFMAILLFILYFIAFSFFHVDSKEKIKEYFYEITAPYSIKSKEQSFEGILQFAPKDLELAYVMGPVAFDLLSGDYSSEAEMPTYERVMFFYSNDNLVPGVVIELEKPVTDQWKTFESMVADIWSRKFPTQEPLFLPDGTKVFELIPNSNSVEPEIFEYKGINIYELSDGNDTNLSYALVDNYVIVSSSTQIVSLALLSYSDILQKVDKTGFSRCLGKKPYEYILANEGIDVENSDLFPNILENEANPVEYCI